MLGLWGRLPARGGLQRREYAQDNLLAVEIDPIGARRQVGDLFPQLHPLFKVAHLEGSAAPCPVPPREGAPARRPRPGARSTRRARPSRWRTRHRRRAAPCDRRRRARRADRSPAPEATRCMISSYKSAPPMSASAKAWPGLPSARRARRSRCPASRSGCVVASKPATWSSSSGARGKRRQRLRSVAGTRPGTWQTSRINARAGGSSTNLSTAFAAFAFISSTASITAIRHPPSAGVSDKKPRACARRR